MGFTKEVLVAPKENASSPTKVFAVALSLNFREARLLSIALDTLR
jgi:hypothetical protein